MIVLVETWSVVSTFSMSASVRFSTGLASVKEPIARKNVTKLMMRVDNMVANMYWRGELLGKVD